MRGLGTCAALALALGGCANLLDIHQLDDAAGDGDATIVDGAVIDSPPGDGPPADALDAAAVDGRDGPPPIDGPPTDGPPTDARIDAPPVDAAIDAPPIDAAPTVDASPIDATPIDGPPIDAGTVTIGEYAVLGQTTSISGNFIIARRFSVGGSTVIVGAGAYLKFEPVGGHVKFAVYNDNAGSPFTRRVFSVDVTLDGVPGYNEVGLGPHTLPAGTYWMVMAADQGTDLGSLDSNNVPGAAQSLPYSSAFPTTYSPQPVSSATTDRINLYLQAQP